MHVPFVDLKAQARELHDEFAAAFESVTSRAVYTRTQDYALFHVVGDFSLDLWRGQVGMVLAEHGLVSFIIHPDYIAKGRPASLHRQLLDMLRQLIDERHLWTALPGEVDRWWHQRAAMRIDGDAGGWHIVGEGAPRVAAVYDVAMRSADGLAYAHDERIRTIPDGG